MFIFRPFKTLLFPYVMNFRDWVIPCIKAEFPACLVVKSIPQQMITESLHINYVYPSIMTTECTVNKHYGYRYIDVFISNKFGWNRHDIDGVCILDKKYGNIISSIKFDNRVIDYIPVDNDIDNHRDIFHIAIPGEVIGT